MPVMDDEEIRDLLGMRSVAVIGCSTTPGKAAHDVPAYLTEQGYDIHPVNPYADEVLGRPAVDTLADVAAEIELVNVFRPSEEVPLIVDQTLARHGSHDDVSGLWLQQGITHDDALARAEDAGLRTVQDRCMKVEHQRLLG